LRRHGFRLCLGPRGHKRSKAGRDAEHKAQQTGGPDDNNANNQTVVGVL